MPPKPLHSFPVLAGLNSTVFVDAVEDLEALMSPNREESSKALPLLLAVSEDFSTKRADPWAPSEPALQLPSARICLLKELAENPAAAVGASVRVTGEVKEFQQIDASRQPMLLMQDRGATLLVDGTAAVRAAGADILPGRSVQAVGELERRGDFLVLRARILRVVDMDLQLYERCLAVRRQFESKMSSGGLDIMTLCVPLKCNRQPHQELQRWLMANGGKDGSIQEKAVSTVNAIIANFTSAVITVVLLLLVVIIGIIILIIIVKVIIILVIVLISFTMLGPVLEYFGLPAGTRGPRCTWRGILRLPWRERTLYIIGSNASMLKGLAKRPPVLPTAAFELLPGSGAHRLTGLQPPSPLPPWSSASASERGQSCSMHCAGRGEVCVDADLAVVARCGPPLTAILNCGRCEDQAPSTAYPGQDPSSRCYAGPPLVGIRGKACLWLESGSRARLSAKLGVIFQRCHPLTPHEDTMDLCLQMSALGMRTGCRLSLDTLPLQAEALHHYRALLKSCLESVQGDVEEMRSIGILHQKLQEVECMQYRLIMVSKKHPKSSKPACQAGSTALAGRSPLGARCVARTSSRTSSGKRRTGSVSDPIDESAETALDLDQDDAFTTLVSPNPSVPCDDPGLKSPTSTASEDVAYEEQDLTSLPRTPTAPTTPKTMSFLTRLRSRVFTCAVLPPRAPEKLPANPDQPGQDVEFRTGDGFGNASKLGGPTTARYGQNVQKFRD
ncbi:hypothetical protein AK812_SmicGene18190 [Symbiodinium microadriaticum]|uniref:Uncharacterized protein n=1 Tax=Symbiodinium microadriaticum TaxID=2951 RepID=A0A1Q9DVX0_SYMMI|nr:hypothetical protein AK812_SmicGene18190 [Symbiodinium microadriaticum]